MLLTLMAVSFFSGLDAIVAPGAQVEKVLTGYKFTEGPAWTRKNTLVFSDIDGDKLIEWDGTNATTFRDPSGKANGNTIGPDGLLYNAGHVSGNVTRTNADGSVTVLTDKFEGKRYNSPNDLVVRKNGDIYFTDPFYGLWGRKAELDYAGVYRLSNGEVTLQSKEFKTPNGIVLSPDEKTCYVADTESQRIWAYDIAKDGNLTNGRAFCEHMPGNPDGIRVDVKGNLYAAASKNIAVYDPKGNLLGLIPIPETTTNCGWGGKDGKTLYVTAQKSVYAIQCRIKGLRH